MASTDEATWARRDDPRGGRESMGCVWYRTTDEEFDVIRVGSTNTYHHPNGFEPRRAATGEQIGIYPKWEDALARIDELGGT